MELSAEDIRCKIKLKRRVISNLLRGKVIISAKRPLVIKLAYIEISGLANCSWKLDSLHCKFPYVYPEDSTVKGFQQFYYTRHSLCGGELPHHHAGEHCYKFMCYWPSRLPGTWFGDFGSIEYIAKVTIKSHSDSYIYAHSQFLFVKFRRNLTLERHLLFEERVDVRRGFFASRAQGNVIVSVWMPISGIAAGQAIPVLCTVTNHSKLHFGSILFILTRIDIYRSDQPIAIEKRVRTDVCRVARTVNIHKGTYEFYSVLETDEDTLPSNQFYKCTCIQIIYEVWISVQGAFKRYRKFGYPNIDTPGIPLVIGTKALKKYDPQHITAEIFKKMYEYNAPIFVDELPEDFKQIIHKTEEELSKEAVQNLDRQLLVNEEMLSTLKKSSSMKLTSTMDLV